MGLLLAKEARHQADPTSGFARMTVLLGDAKRAERSGREGTRRREGAASSAPARRTLKRGETVRGCHIRARIEALLGRFWPEMVRFRGVLEGVFRFT